MEDTMNNINNEAVDTAVEAVKDIELENVPVPPIAEADFGMLGKVCKGVAYVGGLALAGYVVYRVGDTVITWIKNRKNDAKTAEAGETVIVDVESVPVDSDEE